MIFVRYKTWLSIVARHTVRLQQRVNRARSDASRIYSTINDIEDTIVNSVG